MTIERYGSSVEREKESRSAHAASVSEMPLLSGETHWANVRALNDSMLLRIPREAFESVVNRDPRVAVSFSQRLGHRIKQLREEKQRAKWSTIISLYSALPGTGKSTLATNLTSAFLGAKYQIPEMVKQGGGSIIFTSTFVGYSFAFPGTAAYAASKAGLIGLTQALAAEYGPQGVRVNAILPGAVDTEMYRDMNDTAESQGFITGLHALKRVAKPEEIARSALYLASDDSSFVTGTASLVDGGASITRT